MAIGDIIVGIDIGASKISLVVGEVNNFNQVEVVCNTSKVSNGIKKGKIIDENALAESILACVKDSEREMNKKINSAYITIPGKYITIVQNSVTKEAKDKYSGISSRDVSSAIMQAKYIDVPDGKQIIDIVTSNFRLDDGKVIEDPIGAFSSKFTLDAQVILADKSYIRTMSNIFKKVDLDIDGMIPVTLAEKNLVFDEQEQKDCTMILDVGADNTDIGVFDGDKFVFADSIPVGGNNITNDIKLVLDISEDEAEKLKRQYGLAVKSYIENDIEVALNTVKGLGNKNIRSSNIVEIIEARVAQIFELVNKDITNHGLKPKINNCVLTGQGITNISKSDVVGKITLQIPVKITKGKTEGIVKPTYEGAYAVVKYIALRPFTKTVSSSIDGKSDAGVVKKLLYKVKEFFYS